MRNLLVLVELATVLLYRPTEIMRCGLLLAAGGTVCPSALGQSNRTRLYSAFL